MKDDNETVAILHEGPYPSTEAKESATLVPPESAFSSADSIELAHQKET